MCKFYKNGLCIGPKLPEPTDVVTSVYRCMNDNNAKSCPYYVEEEKKGLQLFDDKEGIGFHKVHLITETSLIEAADSCGCEYFTFTKTEYGILTHCAIKGRLMTEGEGKLCILYWPLCPLR